MKFSPTPLHAMRLAVLAAALAWPHGAAATAPDAVQLTFDLAGNEAFAEQIHAALTKTQRRMTGRLCHALGADLPLTGSRPAGCESQARSDSAIVHAYVLRDGLIWRLYSSHPRMMEEPGSLGSVSKTLGAVPLLAKAGAQLGEQWCVHQFQGIANADGSTGYPDCRAAGARIGAVAALARSNNLATIWRLRELPEAQMRRDLLAAGVHNVPRDSSVAVAVALGVIEYTPRQALECFDALVAGQARRAAMVTQAVAAPSDFARWCASARSTPSSVAFVDGLLAAPADPGGTAAFLRGAIPGAAQLRAKTGTPSTASRLDTGKLLVASYQRGGHRYTFLLGLLAPKPSMPLSPKLNATDLLDLVKVINLHTPHQAERQAGTQSQTPPLKKAPT